MKRLAAKRAASLGQRELSAITHAMADEPAKNSPWAICTKAVGRDSPKYEDCVLEVKRRLGNHAEQPKHFFIENLPGGQYVAIQEDDGTWTITSEDRVGLPIFAELEAGARENQQRVGKDWMLQAITRHRMLEQEQQHLPPVHVNHHSVGRETERVGFLRLTKVGKLQQNGKPVDALYAEICGVRDEDLKRIEDLELPYRSVEIGRWDRPEIASLALLADEAPYFKMPMMKVTKRVPRFDRPTAPMVAMAHDHNGAPLILFSFRGAQTLKETIMPKQGSTPKTIVAKKKSKGFSVLPGAAANTDEEEKIKSQNPGLQEDDDTGDTGADADVSSELQDDEDTGDTGDSGDSGDADSDGDDSQMDDGVDEAFANAMRTYLKKNMRKLMAKAAASFKADSGDNPEHGTAPVEPKGAKAKETTMHHLNARYEGRIAALEAKIRKTESEKTRADLVDSAVAKLKADGWEVDPVTVTNMRRLAEKSTAPKEVLQIFCESFKQHAPKDPVKFSDFLSRPENEEVADPPEVRKFSEKGADALTLARDYSSRFDELRENGFPLTVSREEFIASNIEADAENAARASKKSAS